MRVRSLARAVIPIGLAACAAIALAIAEAESAPRATEGAFSAAPRRLVLVALGTAALAAQRDPMRSRRR